MGVYIHGMEMPKGNDAISIIIFPNGKVSLAHDRRFAEYAEAVPVPTPHGRLIDADELSFVESENGCQDDYVFRYDINEIPTIIPAEEEKQS